MILLLIEGVEGWEGGEGGRIIGSVHLQKEGPDCYLGLLVVRPDLQGAGIGKELMREAEKTARETWSARKMTMTVISRRHELIAYYERRGYRRTGRREEFPPDGSHGTPRDGDLHFEVLEKSLDPVHPGVPGHPGDPG